MKDVDISIIVPTLNAEAFIDETLDSLFKAMCYDKSISSEIIIVDGGSNDTTVKRVEDFSERVGKEFIRYISRKDSGAAKALNDGFSMAYGKNLTYCDSDDLFSPDALSIFIKMLNKFDVVVGEREYFKVENGKKITTYTKKTSKRPLLNEITKEKKDSYLLHAHLCSSPLAFTKKIFLETGGINEKMRAAYDYDLALKLIYPGDIYPPGYTDDVLLYYRQRNDSVSNIFRDLQIKEGEVALNDTFKRIGFEGIEAVYTGRDSTGYLYWEHRKI